MSYVAINLHYSYHTTYALADDHILDLCNQLYHPISEFNEIFACITEAIAK